MEDQREPPKKREGKTFKRDRDEVEANEEVSVRKATYLTDDCRGLDRHSSSLNFNVNLKCGTFSVSYYSFSKV